MLHLLQALLNSCCMACIWFRSICIGGIACSSATISVTICDSGTLQAELGPEAVIDPDPVVDVLAALLQSLILAGQVTEQVTIAQPSRELPRHQGFTRGHSYASMLRTKGRPQLWDSEPSSTGLRQRARSETAAASS